MNLTRRELLAGAAVLSACGPRKTVRFPGYAMVANAGNRTLTAIDLAQFRVERQIPLPLTPRQVLRGATPQHALVLAESGTELAEIGIGTMSIERRAQLGGRLIDAQRSPDGKSLFLLCAEPNRLVEFRLADFKPIRHIPLAAAGNALDVHKERAAIASTDGLILIDLATTRHTRIGLEAAPGLLRFRADGKIILAGNTMDRSITAIDCETPRAMVTLPLPIAPRNFCSNADGGQMFVSGEGMDAISIVLPYQTEVDQTILAGHAPGAMVATSAATSPEILFIANPPAGDVTVINIDNRKVVARMQVGVRPTSILLTPDDAYALVLNAGSGDVAVIKVINLQQANLASRRGRIAPLFTLMAIGENPIGGVICLRDT